MRLRASVVATAQEGLSVALSCVIATTGNLVEIFLTDPA